MLKLAISKLLDKRTETHKVCPAHISGTQIPIRTMCCCQLYPFSKGGTHCHSKASTWDKCSETTQIHFSNDHSHYPVVEETRNWGSSITLHDIHYRVKARDTMVGHTAHCHKHQALHFMWMGCCTMTNSHQHHHCYPYSFCFMFFSLFSIYNSSLRLPLPLLQIIWRKFGCFYLAVNHFTGLLFRASE